MRLGLLSRAIAIGLVLVPVASLSADELDTYLASQAKLLEDASASVKNRAGIALEMTAALDRAAARAPTLDDRRARWKRAIGILDQFSRSNAEFPEIRPLQAQAAVFAWATGATWLHQARLSPGNATLRQKATEALDEAIERLQKLNSVSDDPTSSLAQTIRIRLAQALRDRSDLDPEGSHASTDRKTQALDLLPTSENMGELAGLAAVERARLQLSLDQPAEAQKEIDALDENPDLHVPATDLLDVRVRTLLALDRLPEAEKILTALPESQQQQGHQLRLELALKRWSIALSKDDAEGQHRAETDAVQQARTLWDQGGDQAIEALLRLASGLSQASPNLPAADLDLLANGRLRMGRPEEASRLALRASEAARAQGHNEDAATYRLKAAGILLRSNHRIQAQHLLNQIADDESAGALRPKAALLDALAHHADPAASSRPEDQASYESGLSRLIERFPDSEEAGEARWLLGLARQRQDDGASASALWERIPEGHPRWLEAQIARASIRIDSIESSLTEGDHQSAEQLRLEAREALDQMASKVTSDDDRADLVLARARLETVPNLGDPKRAADDLDRLLMQPLNPSRRGQAERLRVLALLELGRSVEAMRATRSLLGSSAPGDLLELARRLDQAASSAPSDLLVRRFGEVLRMVTTHLVDHPEGLSENLRAEARLRELRGLVFHGDSGAARDGLRAWPNALDVLPPEAQPDLARLALDAGDPQRALKVSRVIARRQSPGSRPWFQARLSEAASLIELRDLDKARRLLDATETLHPDLGGERLKRRYETLRERLEREQAFRSSSRP